MTDYVVTGIPRSGTSLLVSMLETDPGLLCFSEPPWIKEIRNQSNSGKQLSERLRDKISSLKNDISQGNPVEMVYQKGKNNAPDNYFKRESGSIKKTRKNQWVVLDQSKSDCGFVIKANAIFTVAIEDLIDDGWQVVPVVRDPLYVLMSWNSVPIASSKGRVKVVERFSNCLREIGQQTPLIKRQVLLLDWYFKQYDRFTNNKVIHYENIIEDSRGEINRFFPNNLVEFSRLSSKNNKKRYVDESEHTYRNALVKYGTTLKKFYPEYG